MKQYIGDKQVTICLQGLRFVKKVDLTISHGATSGKYELQWEYKGSKGSMSYKEKADRDALYDRIHQALTEPIDEIDPDLLTTGA